VALGVRGWIAGRWRTVTTLAASLAMQRSAFPNATTANIQRDSISEWHWLE
jgi:hypothetical protein